MRDRLRLAISGLGLVGLRHAEAIARIPGAGLVAVAEPGAAGAAATARFRARVHADLDALLGAETVDGVIIATPTPLHVRQAEACIDRGLPALVEKPLSDAVPEAEALVRRAARAGVPLLVGHHRRHNPLIARAREVIASGQIGAVRGVQAVCWFYKPDPYFAAAPWRTRRGAGPISVNLVHDVDLVRYLCGEVTAVQAALAPSARGFENEDVASAVLEFDTGAIGTITVSDSIAAPWSWEMTAREYPVYPATAESCLLIGGSEGALSIPDLRVWRHENGPDWWSPISATALIREAGDPLVNQIRHFCEVIRGRAEPLVPGIEGLRTLRAVEAIREAATTHRRVVLPPVGVEAGTGGNAAAE